LTNSIEIKEEVKMAEFIGTNRDNTIDPRSREADLIRGLDGDDRIFGFDGNDVLDGGEGDDSLYGQEGDDSLYGGEGDDFLFGGEDDDAIFGNEDDDFLDGREGDDRLYGGEGEDTLLGFTGDDLIFGDEDDDILEGESGDDTLYGGEGDDIFVFSTILGTGIDTIRDFTINEDKIRVAAEGFDIDTDEFDRFFYESGTGELSFDGEVFAELEEGLDFRPTLDIDIV
jgi:Ca2+-binding RTX toxin-like protein